VRPLPWAQKTSRALLISLVSAVSCPQAKATPTSSAPQCPIDRSLLAGFRRGGQVPAPAFGRRSIPDLSWRAWWPLLGARRGIFGEGTVLAAAPHGIAPAFLYFVLWPVLGIWLDNLGFTPTEIVTWELLWCLGFRLVPSEGWWSSTMLLGWIDYFIFFRYIFRCSRQSNPVIPAWTILTLLPDLFIC